MGDAMTTVPTHGGSAVPVSVVTDSKTIGRVALRAYGFHNEAAALAAGFLCEAGPAMTVIIVTQAQLNAGTFVLEGDPKATVIYPAPAGMRIEGGYSQPIYLVGGSL
jgi:hypothetical protein